ncbi:hypothetical protein AGOR_G00037850 [Albula goreensis]|uniref:Cyclic GMP-AMP synthase n=1 Tax=Albula goreensis TaxID=1534307 RepID=A0A8T3DXF0_9TELE|nr:hypothetical protein AGOR_G00037850 [Albula goreensis]
MNRTTPQRRSVPRRGNGGQPKPTTSTPGSVPKPLSQSSLEICSPLYPGSDRERKAAVEREVGSLLESGSMERDSRDAEVRPTSPSTPTTLLEVQRESQSQTDQQRAAKLVNHLRDNLLEYLKNNKKVLYKSPTVLNTGSYYEKVKINDPNEFDMMLLIPTPRLNWTELEGYNGLHYSVSLTRPTRTKIQDFLLDDTLTISATKSSRTHVFWSNISSAPTKWVLNRKLPNSPAVTVSLMLKEQDEDQVGEELLSLDIVPALEVSTNQAWPLAARDGLKVDNWLGKKVRRDLTSQGFYFVPKKPAGRNLSDKAKESWRISFSHIEKEIIMNHGQARTCCENTANKCCRKKCFKLLKCLIEGLKVQYPEDLERLCSYHGKTTFLHTLSARGNDSQWALNDIPSCFMTLLLDLENHASNGQLPHFFVPACNLFAPPAFPRKALNFLIEALKEQRKLGLPLLQPPSPAPPLTLNPSSPHPSSCIQNSLSKVRITGTIIVTLLFLLSGVAFSVLKPGFH